MQARLGAICTKTEDCSCDVDECSQFDGPKIFVAPSATLSNLPDLNDFPPPAGLQQASEASGAFTHSLQEYVEREVMAAKDHAVVTKNLSSWEYVDLVLSKVSANLSECPPELQEKLVRQWEGIAGGKRGEGSDSACQSCSCRLRTRRGQRVSLTASRPRTDGT